jgi:hypothetical protein
MRRGSLDGDEDAIAQPRRISRRIVVGQDGSSMAKEAPSQRSKDIVDRGTIEHEQALPIPWPTGTPMG